MINFTKVVLKGERIYLKIPALKDATAIFNFVKNPRLTKSVQFPSPKKIEETKKFIQQIRRKAKKEKSASFCVYLNNDTLIGSCGIGRIDWKNKAGEIGYWCGITHQKNGYTKEACLLLFHYGFKKLKLNRIEIHCIKSNLPSAKVAESLGMKKEGLLRSYRIVKGKMQDILVYSFIKSEWR